MAKKSFPITPAIRALRAAKIPFEAYLYDYVAKGGTASGARALDLDEHVVVKTLIFTDNRNRFLVVLMHGDREVSTKNLARQLGLKSLATCAPEVAERQSGYKVGGTSPLGMRKRMPIYIERSVLDLPAIALNGGKRGFLVQVAPCDIAQLLEAECVDVAI